MVASLTKKLRIFWLVLNKDYLIYMIRIESKFDLIHEKKMFTKMLIVFVAFDHDFNFYKS